MPTTGFSIKPQKVKLFAGEQKATKFPLVSLWLVSRGRGPRREPRAPLSACGGGGLHAAPALAPGSAADRGAAGALGAWLGAKPLTGLLWFGLVWFGVTHVAM